MSRARAAALGSNLPIQGEGGKVRFRRNLAVYQVVNEGLIAALCGPPSCGVHDLRLATYMTYDLRPGKPPESKLQGGEGKEGAQSFGKVLVIPDETLVASGTRRNGVRLLGQVLSTNRSSPPAIYFNFR